MTAPTPALRDRSPENRADLAPLYSGLEWPETMIDACLEGVVGTVTADAADQPAVAALHVQEFHVLGGDATSPIAAVLVDSLPRAHFAVGDAGWYDLVRERRGPGVESCYWVPFDNSKLDPAHLEPLATVAHADYEIRPLDGELLTRLKSDPETGVPPQGFRSDDDFLERGFAFCALREGRVVSAAGTFTRSRHCVEIQINTHGDHQRRGLATALCAVFVLRCLNEGLSPQWNAANKRSENLAAKLGFIPKPRRGVLHLPK